MSLSSQAKVLLPLKGATAKTCVSQDLCEAAAEAVNKEEEETSDGNSEQVMSTWHCKSKAFPNLNLLAFESVKDWEGALKHVKSLHKQHHEVC